MRNEIIRHLSEVEILNYLILRRQNGKERIVVDVIKSNKPVHFQNPNNASKEAYQIIDELRENLERSFKDAEKTDVLKLAVDQYHQAIFGFSEQMKKISDYFSHFWRGYWYAYFKKLNQKSEVKNKL